MAERLMNFQRNEMNSLTYLARRIEAITVHNRPSSSSWRCHCSSSPSDSSPPQTNKLFVTGLSWSVDEKSLKHAFSSFGEVTEVRIMYVKETGRSRGFGFINFLKGDDAGCAKYAMDEKAYLGQPSRISFALEKVCGGRVVVPRLNDSGIAAGRKN